MIETEIIETSHGAALGYRHLLGNKEPWLVVIQAEHGYLANDYIDFDFADRIGDSFVIVSGAETFEDLLNKPVTKVSQEARKLGARPGMLGKDVLELFL